MVKIEPDKKKHFWVGMGMGAVLYLFISWIFPHNYGLGIGITFLLIVAVCYGFELFSLITKIGYYEIADAVAGIIGGAIGMGIVLLLGYIL